MEVRKRGVHVSSSGSYCMVVIKAEAKVEALLVVSLRPANQSHSWNVYGKRIAK